jgi:NAD(P)-dependent dehydrogenase (short-subunit alcohol dehydrogenase family)
MNANQVAIVTGGNRGIGLEICRQLAQQQITVILTSRSLVKAEQAAADLHDAGLSVFARQLDTTDAFSIERLVTDVMDEFGRIDILVNNAGVFLDRNPGMSVSADQLRQTFETNVIGPIKLMQTVIPHMRQRGNGRIVNVSSRMGSLEHMGSGSLAYRSSKSALNAATRVFSAENVDSGILINACHPGWVQTDMGGPNASLTIEDGADTPVWLATLPDDGPTGGFFADRKPLAW